MTHEEAYACAIYPLVRSLAINFSRDVRNLVEGPDLMQVGMIAALKLYRRPGGETPPPQRLIARASRSAMIDHLRGLTHRGKQQTEPLPDFDFEVTAAIQPCPEAAIIRAIDLSREVDTLPERERQVAIGLSEGKTLREIGEEMNVHATWIFQLKVRLRNQIRERAR